MGADVADVDGASGVELLLETDVPLLRARRLEVVAVPDQCRHANGGRGRPGAGVRQTRVEDRRRRDDRRVGERVLLEDPDQRLVVVDAVRAAVDGPAARYWIPRDPDARLDVRLVERVDGVAERRILAGDDDPVQRIAGTGDDRRAGGVGTGRRLGRIEARRLEVGERVVRIGDRRIQRVADAVIDGDVGARLPRILREHLVAVEAEVYGDVALRLRVGAGVAARTVGVAAEEVVERRVPAAGREREI